jgi:molybdate-binding protein
LRWRRWSSSWSEQGVLVDMQYRSSTEAVAALARGECDLAGFHLPVGELRDGGGGQVPAMARIPGATCLPAPGLPPAGHVRRQAATRRASATLDDLARPDLRFVNRQHGSGTRVLLELLLADKGPRPGSHPGFDSAEFTHAAVAAYVASGMADVSFGVETAARRFDLDFIPVCRERYFLACAREAPAEPLMAAALAVMESAEFKGTLAGLPGYDGALSGQRLALQSLF